MKKVLPVVLASVALLGGAGCASTQPESDTIQTPPAQEEKKVVENTIPSQKTMPNSPQEKVQAIDAQIASLNIVLPKFPLPVATQGITKREMSGNISEESTGKVTIITEGAATVKESYYFDKGMLVGAVVETSAAGETSKKEMYFENKKAVAFLSNGKDDMSNKNLSYLEEQYVADAQTALDTFTMKKQVSGE